MAKTQSSLAESGWFSSDETLRCGFFQTPIARGLKIPENWTFQAAGVRLGVATHPRDRAVAALRKVVDGDGRMNPVGIALASEVRGL